MRSRLRWFGVPVWSALSATVVEAQTPRPAVNLVTHSEVEIARPAVAIWPLIVDPSGWKQGAKLVRRSGPAGQVGEVFAALAAPNGEAAFLVENVELVAARRRTIKLYLPDGQLIGYASWWLAPKGSRTVVGYDVYSETRPPAGSNLTAEAIAAQEKESVATNGKRFDAELQALKRLAERR